MNKKILFCINTLNKAGAEVVLINMANKLVELNYDVDIAVLFNEGELLDSINPNIKIIPILSKGKLNIAYKRLIQLTYFKGDGFWKSQYSKVIKEKYDVEIAFLEGPSYLFISNSINPTSKKIGWIHIELDQHNFKVNKKSFNKSLEKMDELVFVSNYIKYNFLKTRPYLAFKSSTIYNYIKKEDIIIKSKEVKDFIRLPKGKLNLICVGRLNYQKGFDRIIRICSNLNKTGLEFNLHIIGRGPEEKKLKKLAESYDLSNIVFFHGFKKNPYSIMAQGDLFILPSRYEGFGLVVIESSILKVPVLVTDIPGPAELVKEYNIGWVVDNKVNELEERLKELLKDKKQLESKKEELMIDFWNEEKIINEITSIIERK